MESPSKAVITPLRQKPKRGLFYTAHGIDIPLLIILMLLLSIGLVCMFSASYVYAGYYDGDSYFYIKKQALFAVLGGLFVVPLPTEFNYVLVPVSICVVVAFRLRGRRRSASAAGVEESGLMA